MFNDIRELGEGELTEIIEVIDLSHFIETLTEWHTNKVQVLEHMLEIPSGSVMEKEDGVEIILGGDYLLGFKAGVELALMELGKLPFIEVPKEMH